MTAAGQRTRSATVFSHPSALLILAVLAVLGAATATPWHLTVPELLLDAGPGRPLPSTEPSPPPAAPRTDASTGEPDDTILTTLIVLGAIILVLLLWAAGRTILRALRDAPRKPPEPDTLDPGGDLATAAVPTVPLPELADAVTRALQHLDDARTPTDAVIAAWVALEDAAAEHGTARDPAQTPTEFTQAILATTPAPPGQVATLRTLYQRARFTTHPTEDDDVTAARTALTRIARSLDTRGTAP
ncbi:DUF4129 domain-containing protein [Isoptericola sp. S6320L]|uniref:DUF4129 domain-containing protein n=1 Tax=Isoptericola sp. S6320L TaxID=2926411 RepID=UPI00248D1D94|nr:DUF4129 domain-containing protein [Isoptericola sp. S6320L]